MRPLKLNLFRLNKIKIDELNSLSRDKNIIKQIGSSVILKSVSVIIGFLLIPFLLNKLGNEKYGIWSTLLTIMQWIALMDIGIGNGLRNKLAEALSKNNLSGAREYVSTAYFALAFFGVGLMLILTPGFFFFNWARIFNTHIESESTLRVIAMTFIYSMIIYVILSLLNQVLSAVQRNSLTSIILILGNLVFLGILSLISIYHKINLTIAVVTYSTSLIFSIITISVFFFAEYENLRPSIKFFKRDKIRSILDLGLKFFLMQIVSIIIFCTDNVIITQILGPQFVTVYTVPLVIFNNIGIFMNMMMMPLYASYTEAYSKGDIQWIRGKVILLCKLIFPIAIVILLVVIFCDDILKLWLRKPFIVPKYLPMLMGIYSIISIWNNIFAYVLNGISKLRLGMYLSIIVGLINIPFAIFLTVNLKLGLNGVILSNILCLGLSSIIAPVQVYYFIFSKRKSSFRENLLR